MRGPARIAGTQAVLAAIMAAILLSLSAGALAARAGTVAPGGTVAGKGYGYWLEQVWALTFVAAPPTPKPCETVTVDGQQVAVLPTVGATAPGSYRRACTEPAGRPIYLEVLSNEFST